MKRVAQLALLSVLCLSCAAMEARAQRLKVDPAHPYDGSVQKQSEKLNKKNLKKQEKAQKKSEKARHKEFKKQQKEASKINQARQKQIEQAQHH